MLFGHKERFGIEFNLAEDHGGAWLFGKLCYWLRGERVGAWDLGTSLRDVFFNWSRIMCDENNRSNDTLMALDSESLIKTLSLGLFGHVLDDDDPLYARVIEEQWARHNVNPNVDVFDEWYVYLVEDTCEGRCVYQQIGVPIYHECLLKKGEFDQVLNAAVRSLEQYYTNALNTE